MSFSGILFAGTASGERGETAAAEPACFHDLNLDQVVDAIAAGREEYDLKPFYHARLTDLDGIAYRHEVMRDLEVPSCIESIRAFAQMMRTVRAHLTAAENLCYHHQKQRWFLDGVALYAEAVATLREELHANPPPGSRGLLAFRNWLADYAETAAFKARRDEAATVRSALDAVRYGLLIKDGGITVCPPGGGGDYSAVIEETFARFKHGAPKDYRVKFPAADMNHVEARILELVAKLNPGVFQSLDAFCERHHDFIEPTVAAFDREIQFYIAWLEYVESFRRVGLSFCYPHLSATDKAVSSRESFDVALAGKLLQENTTVVCNDFQLAGAERILVVTGPNQGGKTTFARAFGQLHYLASLGVTVPGAEARLFLCDRLFTHFEKSESIATLRGKLQDDLVRIHRILAEATPGSVIIMNEIFSSTTLQDASFLGREIVARIARLDALCVCVTFLDELASLNEKTVSAVAQIAPDNPAHRTHKILRTPADGLSYALSLAEKHRLTYERLKARLAS